MSPQNYTLKVWLILCNAKCNIVHLHKLLNKDIISVCKINELQTNPIYYGANQYIHKLILQKNYIS